jgi:2-haloacid dehalogenase
VRRVAVRALVFDVFGTLVDWRTSIARAFADAGVAGDPHELADDWRARYVPILEEVNRGARPWGDFDELHRATLDALLAERGSAPAAADRDRLVHAWHRLEPWPDVVEGLRALRRDRLTATLSNGHLGLLVDLARHGELPFDCVLSAELARAYKPASEVYLMAAHLLRVAPQELMLVACHPWDLAGARAAGLGTALVDRPLEYGPGSPEREDPLADVRVADLHELAARLPGTTSS